MSAPTRTEGAPTRRALLGAGLGGALCGGSAVGAAEGLYVLSSTRPTEYHAFAYGAALYGLAGLVLGVPLGILLALLGRRAGLAGPRAWVASAAATMAGLGTFVLAGRADPGLAEALGARPSLVFAAATGVAALALAWFGGHVLARTPLRVLATARGTLGAWLAFLVVAELLSVSPAPGAADTLTPGRVQADTFPDKPDLLLIVVDGLRADAIGAYRTPAGPAVADPAAAGRDAVHVPATPATPALDAFAADAVLFEQHVASAGAVAPALASIFTAQPPSTSGVRADGDVLGDAPPTLAERLRDGGYATGGLPAAALVAGARGFDRGFDWYPLARRDPLGASESAAGLTLYGRLRAIWEQRVARPPADAWHVPASLQLERAWRFLAANEGARVFAFVHLAEPDLPWFARSGEAVGGVRRPPADEAEARALYADEVVRLDAALGAFLDRLRAAGRYDDAVIVVTATRGIELGARGVHGPGEDLHDDVVRVPLLVKLPRGARAGTRVPWQVRSVDLAPTLVELAGFDVPPEWRGVTVFDDWFDDDLARLAPPPVEPDEPPAPFTPPGWAEHPGSRPALAERVTPLAHVVAVREGGRKHVRTRGAIVPSAACYDLLADPAERAPIAADDARCRRADIADAILGGWTGVRPPPAPVEDEAPDSLGADAVAAPPSEGE